MPRVIDEGRVLRGQFDGWQRRGLIDTETARARYVETFRTIERENSQDAAVRFSVCLVLADAFFEAMTPLWKMTVVMKKYKLEQNFDQWFKKREKERAGVYKAIGGKRITFKRAKIESSELFAFIKQPELIHLHNYLWYYRGHSEIKKVGWGNYLEFCEFVEALERDLLKFKKVMKEMVLLWEGYIRDKFIFFVTAGFARVSFFNRGGPKENKEFTLALLNSVSKEKQKEIMSEVRKWLNRYKSRGW